MGSGVNFVTSLFYFCLALGWKLDFLEVITFLDFFPFGGGGYYLWSDKKPFEGHVNHMIYAGLSNNTKQFNIIHVIPYHKAVNVINYISSSHMSQMH